MKIARAIGILILLGLIGICFSSSPAFAGPMNLSWTDNSSNETGFEIERCTGSGCSAFAKINQVGANVTTFIDATLTEGATGCYRVRAFNATAFSGYSNVACGVSSLNVPTNLQVQSQ